MRRSWHESAIRLVVKGGWAPSEHHLRLWYGRSFAMAGVGRHRSAVPTKGARDGDEAVRRCRRIREEGAGDEENDSTEAGGEKKPSAAVGKKITQTAVIKDPAALRSTVWVEI